MNVPERIYVIVASDGRMVDATTDLNQQLADAETYADEYGGDYEVHQYVPAVRVLDPFGALPSLPEAGPNA